MRWTVMALGALLLQEPPEEPHKRREARIAQLVEWLANPDPDVRAMGEKDLPAFGRDALPAIEKKLEEKGAGPLVKMLRELGGAPPKAAAWVEEKEIKGESDDPGLKELAKLDKGIVDKYVQGKYREALAYAGAKNFQRGLDLSSALLVLEPRSGASDAVRRLKRYCDTMITQTTLIEAKVFQERIFYASGEPVELTLRLRNLFKSAMQIEYEKPAGGGPAKGVVVVEIEVRITDWDGHSRSFFKHQELSIDGEIPLATGAQWERKFLLDVKDELDDRLHPREVVVNAWTQPGKIETEGKVVTRRLQFEPGRVKLVPATYVKFLENPLEGLKKTMEQGGGTAHDVFVCTQILPEDQREAAIELLIRWLEKAEVEKGRIAGAKILASLTGQKFGTDARAWADWRRNKGKKPTR